MRPLLFAGSSLLAISASVAAASATTENFINGSSSVNGQLVATGFLQNDVLVNPDGLFNGRLQGDGNFVVSYGTAPNTSLDWSAGHSNPGGGPYGLSSYRGSSKLFGTSLTSYVIYNNSPTNSFYELAGSNYYNAPTFLSLNDNGTLSIYPGTDGKATGGAITTIASPDATNLTSLDLTMINYDLNKGTISNPTPVASASIKHINNTDTTQTTSLALSLTHSDTETYDWKVSNSVAVSIESKGMFGVPGLTSETTIGITASTTFETGQSTTSGDATAFTATDFLETPPHSTYEAEIVATMGDETVPYTFTGTAHYQNGATGTVTGSGVFSGVSTGGFEIENNCVDSPTHCMGVSPTFVPLPGFGSGTPVAVVPEPSSLLLFSAGGLGLAIVRRKKLTEMLSRPC